MRTITKTGVRLFSHAFVQASKSLVIIDNPSVAEQVAQHIINSSPRTEKEAKDPERVKLSIAAGPDMSYSIALAMQQHITTLTDNCTLRKRLACYDLKIHSIDEMKSLGGKSYSNLAAYLDAAFMAVAKSDKSIVLAGKILGMNYQPTARNIVLCHMNHLKGHICNQ